MLSASALTRRPPILRQNLGNTRSDMSNEPIKMWPFHDAPEDLQALSRHGGDEDWIAVVPAHLAASPLAEDIEDRLPVCDCQRIRRDDGSLVMIGAHA